MHHDFSVYGREVFATVIALTGSIQGSVRMTRDRFCRKRKKGT